MKVAVYGLGRIGRLILRLYLERQGNFLFNIELITDTMSEDLVTHLVNYDSVHGALCSKLKSDNGKIYCDGKMLNYVSCNDPAQIDYKKFGIEVVVDASGMCKKSGWADKHIKSGAKRVVISTIVDDAEETIVYGINHEQIDTKSTIISNASCTSNCIIPILYVLQKEYGILMGNINSIHAYTNGQNIVDGKHDDFCRSRSVFHSMIPSTTNASTAINKFFPEFQNKVKCTALRVPIANVSAIDCNLILNKKTTTKEVNEIFINYSKDSLKDILSVNEESLVSIDFNSCLSSCVIDLPQTSVTESSLCRIFAWYNNELAYANRVLDLVNFLCEKEGMK
jgi:glyceraldehyde 3-phosphate dehydrogenase